MRRFLIALAAAGAIFMPTVSSVQAFYVDTNMDAAPWNSYVGPFGGVYYESPSGDYIYGPYR